LGSSFEKEPPPLSENYRFAVVGAISLLNERDTRTADAVVLHYVYDVPRPAIAEMMDLPEETVTKLITSGRNFLIDQVRSVK
jgi:DNA-directed RNA polymerase specialized sigma24 family protein